MVKKLLLKVFTFWALILTSALGWGQCPTSVSISASPGNTICAGTPVTFTANPSGGEALQYQWQINNVNVPNEINSTFTSTSLTNGQKVRVVVTSTTEGIEACSTSSSEISMTVNAVQTPTVSISTSKTSVCRGESITFNTSNTYGGTSPTYEWYINSSNSVAKTGASATFSSTDFVEGINSVRVVLTSNFNCAQPTTAEATSANFELKPDATISTPANNDQSVCINTAIQNIAFGLDGGATNATVTGLPSGVTGALSGGNFVLSGTPTTKGTFSYTITTSGTCAQKTATGTLTVNPDATIALTSGNNTQTVCAAGGVVDGNIDPINYSIGETGTGATVTGLPSGITGSFISGTFTIQGSTSVTGTHNYSVKATGTCGESATLTGSITVTENKTPSVSIVSNDDDNIICAGTSVTFTATPTDGGTSPSYQWKIGDSNVGSNSPKFTTSDLIDGQAVTVVMSSSETCLTAATATSSAITTTVNPNLSPEVTITTSDSDICPGDPVTFTATPVHGGSAPSYQWKVGNTNVGTNSSTFTTTELKDGQSVSVVLTSNETCLATATATSNSVATTVQAPPPATPGAITGPQEVCATATGLVYSVAAVPDAESYVWSFPDDSWQITAGSGTNSITVSPSSTGGNITVAAMNSCGTSTPASLAVTSVTGVPGTPGSITTSLPSTAICPPLSNQTFSVTPVDGAKGYEWILPSGWEITSGANTSSITVNITAAQSYVSPTTVKVKATNICGESGISTSQDIYLDNFIIADIGPDLTTCKALNPIPQLTLNGNMSFGNANLSPQFSTSGSGTFQNIPSNKKGKFSVNYTPSQADYDLGQVKITMTIPQITSGNSTSCGTGKDEMTIFFKPLPTATITAASPVCHGNTSTLTFTGTPNSRITYKLPNGTNQTVDLDASGTATVTTAALTANSTYSLVSSVNLDTPACTYNFPTTASTTITVTPTPTAAITYSGAPFCTSSTTDLEPTLTGTNGYIDGTYSADSKLTINSSTGAITPSSSTPGTYTVTYSTPEGGGCAPVTATTEVTITQEPTATISYSGTPFCTSDSEAKPVTLDGTDNYSGGTFSAPDGLTIDTGTGAITASSSKAGTYTVTYQTPEAGGCSPVPATTTVTITEAPTASISYAGAPFCHSNGSAQAVTLTGTDAYTGGTFTAPSGVSINSLTGAITPASSTPGTYEITYTTPASEGCGEVATTTSITITETPAAAISYSGPYCTSDTNAHLPAFTNTAGAYQGGVFSTTTDGLSLDASTGAVNANNSSPGTYTVFYELPVGEGCGTSEISTSVTITQVPQLDISYTTPLCTSDSTSYPAIFSSDAVGAYQDGTFTATPGLAIDSAGNISAANSTPGTHTVTYTTPEANGCGPIVFTTDVEIFEQVVITTPPVNVGICSTEPASFEVVASGDNLSYQWKRTDGAAITNATGVNTSKLSFSNATATNAGEYYVEISGSSPCSPVSSGPVTLNVDENIVIIKPTTDITFCDQAREGVTFEFIAHAKGAPLTFTWIKDGTEIPNVNTERFTFNISEPSGDNGEYTGTMTISGPNPADNGVYAVKITGPEHFTCSEATSKTFTLNVTPLPEPPTTEPVVLCQGETAQPLTASGATGATFKWYESEFGDDLITGTPTPGTGEANIGTTSYWVSQTTEICESPRTELVVTVNPTPALPTTEESIILCFEEENVPALSATETEDGSVLNWYGPNDSTVALSAAPTPLTTSTGNTKYWVSQSLGDCESDLVEIVVTVKPLPELVVTADNQNICEGSSTILHASGADTYVWSLNGDDIGTTADITVTPVAAGSYTYKVTGTDTFGCVNTNEIVIEVETPSKGGLLTGPSSVCTGENTGTLVLSESLGEIVRWESSTDGTTWTTIAETSTEYTFTNLATDTQFQAVVKNGVCGEAFSSVTTIKIDPLPVGGELAFEGYGRTIETCSNPGPDYTIPLSLTGETGNIVRWRYKEGSAANWSYVMEGGEYFKGTTLSPELIRSLGINQSTIFEVEIGSGACSPNAISQNATLGIVSSDIAPNPVTVTPGVVCLGEEVTLSGSTGYGTGPGMEAGAFDYSSITNKGWRIKDKNGVESNFDSSADNGVAAIWLRTNPLPLTTANLTAPYSTYTYRNWDSSAGDEGNKGFAVVSGPNPSTLETSVFNLFAVDNPVLTFDQAYNLTPGSAIYVDISTDGGATYNPVPLFELVASNATDGTSGNYDSFGDDDANPENKMSLDLTDYANLPNLRIRFRYVGTRPGDVWAVDAISLPVEPTNVDLTWTDYTDPENPIIIGTDNSEQWAPKLIGWNDFEIRTRLTFDSTGQQCPVVENWKTISVFVFDKYLSTATANAGPCGTNSVPLSATVINSKEVDVTGTTTADGYAGRWEVVNSPSGYTFNTSHFTDINNPTAIFTPGMAGEYTIRWVLSTSAVGADGESLANETCPPEYVDTTFEILDCTTLDFDGVDDYVDLGTNYQGSNSFEAWIRPFNRPLPDNTGETNASNGTIISGPGFEIGMNDLPAIGIGTRWYHIAVSSTGELWVDGIPSTPITLKGNGGSRTIIGAKWNSSLKKAENHFSGWIEEVRIWTKPITEEHVQFLMNQRLIQNGTQMGEQIPMDVPGGLNYSDLAGYYRLISADPEPLTTSPVVYLDVDKPTNGTTPDRAVNKVAGRLMNMTTNQENTAPLPYYSANDGVWATDETWLRPDVWDPPHTGAIEWNIARTSHNITSGSRDIFLLGLISEVNTLDMEGENPGSWITGGTGNQLFLSHYLLLDGVIDLNGESQLVQPMGSIVDASSGGHLDRDQQGTASSYNYNYWSSPVGPGASNAAYSVGAVMMDGSTPTPQALNFGTAYTHADGDYTSPRRISAYWLHRFHGTANDYFTWAHIGNTGTINAGEGYSMKGTAGTAAIEDAQNYTFRGLPNNGDVTPGSTGTNQNYLVGNPYPSAIDANLFIADNLAPGHKDNANVFNGTVYFWSHFANQTHYLEEYVGGYAAYNLSGGVMAVAIDERINPTTGKGGQVPQQYIPVGQAFFINTVLDPSLVEALQNANLPATNVSGGEVVFRNSQRAFIPENNSKGGSVFNSQEKKDFATGTTNSSATQGVEQNKIWLKFKSPKGYHRQILVTADQRATENFDLGFDAPLIEDNVEDMYWYFNNYQFVIQGVPDFNLERVLDLGIKVDQKGSLSISIDDLENISDEMNIYLADSLLQVVHDLRVEPYETESEAGIFTDRFKLVFQDKTQVVEPEDPVVIEEGPFEILYVTGTRNVLLRNPELIQVDRVYLNNMLGQQVHVYYDVPLEREVELPVSRFSAGVYIVKVHSDKGIFTKKVILE